MQTTSWFASAILVSFTHNMDTSPLITRITQLEDEVEVLRKERDRFRRIAWPSSFPSLKRRKLDGYIVANILAKWLVRCLQKTLEIMTKRLAKKRKKKFFWYCSLTFRWYLFCCELWYDDFQVKETWGKKIQTHKKYLVYCKLRARMTLRLGGTSNPTDKAVENEVVRIKRKDYTSNLTAQDVIAAFERGDEVRMVYCSFKIHAY